MKSTSLTPAAFSTRKRILALLVAMLLLSTMLPVSAIGLDSPEKAEPAWTAEEIAGTFHVSEENITQLQEDDNGHTLFVLDEYTFVCAPNGARAAAVTYTADYPIELIVSCTENGVMLGSALPYVENPSDGMIWDGTYEFLDYDTGEVTPVKDANAFYVENANAPVALASYTTTINRKVLPHPSYPAGDKWNGTYSSPYGFGNDTSECHGFGLMIFDYLFEGAASKVTKNTSTTSEASAKTLLTAQADGTFIRATNNHNGEHSLILMGQDISGVYIYHANWVLDAADKNLIKVEHITWNVFASRHPSVVYVLTPCAHVVSKWKQFDSQYHKGTCTKCGKAVYKEHYAQVAGPNATCVVCKYVGNMGGATRSIGTP